MARVPEQTQASESAALVRKLLSELTHDRLIELAEMRQMEIGEDASRATLEDAVVAVVDHEALLEFASTHELKDFCRSLELPEEGGDPASLRKRIRVALYFPSTPTAEPPPPGALTEKEIEERQARVREHGRRHAEMRRRRALRTAAVGAVVSGLCALPLGAGWFWTALIATAGATSAWNISWREFDRMRGLFLFGGVHMAITFAAAFGGAVAIGQGVASGGVLMVLLSGLAVAAVTGCLLGLVEEHRED